MQKRAVGSSVSANSPRQLRESVSRDPRDTDAWLRLYAALLDRSEVQAAESVAREALHSAAVPARIASRHARTLIGRGELSRARDLMSNYRPGTFDEGHEALLAWLLQNTRHHQEAAAAYRALLARNAELGDWWVGLGISLEYTGDRNGALHAYERARDSAQIKTTLFEYARQRVVALNAKEE